MYQPGSRVRVIKQDKIFEGILMPSPTGSVVIKLDSGYNIGILDYDSIQLISEPAPPKLHEMEPTNMEPTNSHLPLVSIICTGGTIASRVDYRTGAVTSQFSSQEILDAIPELKRIARFRSKLLFNILSENMDHSRWVEIAREVYHQLKSCDGVIVTHGTDTMHYTSAALCFMLRTPAPVVLVGAQRSPDRPSTDAAINSICAAHVAVSDLAQVCVVMRGSINDDYCLIHHGARVRKMHTSRRDAFQSKYPLGKVYPDGRLELWEAFPRRGEQDLELRDKIEHRCALLKFYPGAPPEILEFFVESGYRGILIEGTGLGHVSSNWIPKISEAVKQGVAVVIASQCLSGRVCCRVYDTGRDLLRAGAIEAGDMLPEVAYVKLCWVLGQTQDLDQVSKLMASNIAGELNPITRMGDMWSLRG